jgi:hypothetical protein
MRTVGLIAIAALCTVSLTLTGAAKNNYVSVKKCMACHKVPSLGGVAYVVWSKSAHAKAFETLKGKEAAEIAKKKGLTKPASDSPECLKCHVTWEAAKDEGVTCEGCHGPASGYLMLHNKKTPDALKKAEEAGLVIGDAVKKVCVDCHNADSPTSKEFKFDPMWAQIKHSGPEKKK